MGRSIIAFLTNLIDLITGPLGTLVIALGIIGAGLVMLAGQMERGTFGTVLKGAALVYGGAWLASVLVA